MQLTRAFPEGFSSSLRYSSGHWLSSGPWMRLLSGITGAETVTSTLHGLITRRLKVMQMKFQHFKHAQKCHRGKIKTCWLGKKTQFERFRRDLFSTEYTFSVCEGGWSTCVLTEATNLEFCVSRHASSQEESFTRRLSLQRPGLEKAIWLVWLLDGVLSVLTLSFTSPVTAETSEEG